LLAPLDHLERQVALEIMVNLGPLVNLGLLGPWGKGVHLDPRACRASRDHLVSLVCRE
jgi:hypothetical protein